MRKALLSTTIALLVAGLSAAAAQPQTKPQTVTVAPGVTAPKTQPAVKPQTTPTIQPAPLQAAPIVRGQAVGTIAYWATGQVISRTNGVNEATTAQSGPMSPTSALSRFKFGFENGDHKLRLIQVMPQSENRTLFSFSDQNGDDPFNADAAWWNVNNSPPKAADVVWGAGSGVFEIRMSARPGYVPAIRGFSFQRQDGTDANVRLLGIELLPDQAEQLKFDLAKSPSTPEMKMWMARVRLVDDEGPDFRNPVKGLAIAASPMEALASMAAAKLAMGRGVPGGRRPYVAGVAIGWLPESAIASQGAISGTERGRDAAAVPAGAAAITGFQFEFGNSDHHLLEVKVDLADGGDANFQDNNKDDPMRWWVNYASLKTSR